MLQRRILFLSFQKFGFTSNICFSFFADDEPIDIIFHVSSTREKQDYRRQFERKLTFILIDIYVVILILGHCHRNSKYYHVNIHKHTWNSSVGRTYDQI